MGTIIHNAIVVTGTNISLAADMARSLGLQVLGPSESVINGYQSILVCPDGSKEGWEDSDKADALRAQFRTWLNSRKNEGMEWVEVRFGPDTEGAYVLDDSMARPD